MKDSNSGGVAVFLILAVKIVSIVWAGVIAYDWLDPDDAFSFIGFLVVWSIMGFCLERLLGILGLIIISIFSKD